MGRERHWLLACLPACQGVAVPSAPQQTRSPDPSHAPTAGDQGPADAAVPRAVPRIRLCHAQGVRAQRLACILRPIPCPHPPLLKPPTTPLRVQVWRPAPRRRHPSARALPHPPPHVCARQDVVPCCCCCCRFRGGGGRGAAAGADASVMVGVDVVLLLPLDIVNRPCQQQGRGMQHEIWQGSGGGGGGGGGYLQQASMQVCTWVCAARVGLSRWRRAPARRAPRLWPPPPPAARPPPPRRPPPEWSAGPLQSRGLAGPATTAEGVP